MKHQWRIRRQLKPYPDRQQRWDRAYQALLQWTIDALPMESTPPSMNSDLLLEVSHENSSLCTGLDIQSNSDPDHRTTT
jgi:hypothetical protein